jgi:septum site-determining protein MinC
MTLMHTTRRPVEFDLRSANLPLVVLQLRSTDLNRLNNDFAMRFGNMPNFFDQEDLVVDLSCVRDTLPEGGEPGLTLPLDFAGLCAMLRGHQLRPLGVHGGNEQQMAAAL